VLAVLAVLLQIKVVQASIQFFLVLRQQVVAVADLHGVHHQTERMAVLVAVLDR
jgi:hypothetical protein